jgi:PIN domain nuclease of toxin-antitoxin system
VGVTVLLDTHALLWAVGCPEKLSARIRTQLEDPLSTVLVSTASAWEIATKYRIGKLDEAEEFLANYHEHLSSLKAMEVPITTSHALMAGGFHVDHRDPFDRVIAAQAVVLGLPVTTKDAAFKLFPCRTVW